jgi:hypothetical protein
MVAIAIFDKRPKVWENGIGAGKPIFFDASLREDHGVENIISEDVIESDASVTDHIFTRPPRLVIEWIVSRHPAEIIPNVDASRHIKLYKRIEALVKRRTPFDIVTSLKPYTNMVGSLRTTRGPRTSNIIIATLELQQVRFSSIDQSQLIAEQAHDIALAAENLGNQAVEAVPL